MDAASANTMASTAGLTGHDPKKGIVMLDFEGKAVPGDGGTLSAANGGSYVLVGGVPKQSAKLVTGGDSLLFFNDVAVGSTTVSLTPSTCKEEFSFGSYPISANTMTIIWIYCSRWVAPPRMGPAHGARSSIPSGAELWARD